MTIGLKKIVSAAGKAINHLRPAHSLGTSPGVEITIAMERDAMLLDAHVAHPHFFYELINRHAFGPF
jgi:hypothetical protein